MKKKKRNRSKGAYVTAILFVAAVLLLLGSVAGSSQAALTYYSENYSAELRTFDIGVTLVENEKDVSWRNYTQRDDKWYEGGNELLLNMLYKGTNGEQEALQLNKEYKEELCVRNSGNIDEYVRVTIYRYWVKTETNPDGTPVPLEERDKITRILPGWIKLDPWDGEEHPGTYNGWVLDESASTAERVVLYYTGVLGTGQKTPDFTDKLLIDTPAEEKIQELRKEVKGTDKEGIYDNVEFVLQVDVDAVQTHNAEDAIKSAWGIDVTVDANGNLSLRR